MNQNSNFLNSLVHNQSPVYIYLVSGIKLKGVIKAVDEESLLLTNNTPQLVYKHAISSIIPLLNK